jgi:hypothetical protein
MSISILTVSTSLDQTTWTEYGVGLLTGLLSNQYARIVDVGFRAFEQADSEVVGQRRELASSAESGRCGGELT